MPDNTNVQAIRFCNEELRVAADAMESAIRTARQLTADYAAKGIGPLVAGDQTVVNEFIADNSDVDGRTRLLGFDVDTAIGKFTALLAWIDSQAGLEAAIAKCSVNSAPRF